MVDIVKAIAEITPLLFTPQKGAKIRVGYLHDQVLFHLKLKPTHQNRNLIRAVIKSQGARSVTIQGKRYYAGLPKFWTYRRPSQSNR